MGMCASHKHVHISHIQTHHAHLKVKMKASIVFRASLGSGLCSDHCAGERLVCLLLMQSALRIATVHCVEQAEAVEESLDSGLPQLEMALS